MLLVEPELQAPAAAHQRVNGAARIEFGARRQSSHLVDLYQRAPCRVLFPDVEDGEPPQAVLLTTSGGLTGGDRLRVELRVGAHAQATLTTQAAEKIYRALPGGGDVEIATHVMVGPGGYAEWFAQETILFDRARLRRHFVADLEGDACLLATESIVLGRSAMDESLRSGFVHDAWRIRRDGRLAFADALHLDGDIAALRDLPFGFGAARACGTVLLAAPAAASLLEQVRTALGESRIAHATTREGLLIVRVLAPSAAALRAAILVAAGALRQALRGLAPRLPQVWHC